MPLFPRLLDHRTTVSSYCDLPCSIYDPAQARIEDESVKAICEKYQANEDPVFRGRAVGIINERAQLAKEHLAVLWHDYFKAPHFEEYPELHMLINNTIKQASGTGAKQKIDPAEGQKLLDGIDEIAAIFWETKGKTYEKPAA